ncbi:Hypothetical protein UNSWCD_952 [Campylobacter concisus UNSWCD]|nr:Hypothetical protein UNSWCD_952 [Campylobacter concisus UNSWCD]
MTNIIIGSAKLKTLVTLWIVNLPYQKFVFLWCSESRFKF